MAELAKLSKALEHSQQPFNSVNPKKELIKEPMLVRQV